MNFVGEERKTVHNGASEGGLASVEPWYIASEARIHRWDHSRLQHEE